MVDRATAGRRTNFMTLRRDKRVLAGSGYSFGRDGAAVKSGCDLGSFGERSLREERDDTRAHDDS
ncbi:hypothetical protein GCM10027056_08020 [Glaciibacter psychrotolerans]